MSLLLNVMHFFLDRYIVFNERVQSRRVHVFGIKSKADLKAMQAALPKDMTDNEAANARAASQTGDMETFSAKYVRAAKLACSCNPWGLNFCCSRSAADLQPARSTPIAVCTCTVALAALCVYSVLTVLAVPTADR